MNIKQFIDLSVALENDVPVDPPGLEPHIDYVDHQVGAGHLEGIFPGLNRNDLPDGEGWAVENIRLTSHSGTHMDAPWHYASTMNRGERAATIDEVPLEWCLNPGVKIDFRHFDDGHIVTGEEMQEAFSQINHKLSPFEIVLVNTAAGASYGQPEYLEKGCGIGREATLWLLNQGVRVVGTDAWSWDAPFSFVRKRFIESGDSSLVWEGHKAGMEIGYCHMEKLTNLDLLPSSGFLVSCFPYKIKGASAGFTRCVAMIGGE